MTGRTINVGGNQGRGDPPLSRTPGRAWRLEFEIDGMPFLWTGVCVDLETAERTARQDLAADHPEFFTAAARLVACLERRA